MGSFCPTRGEDSRSRKPVGTGADGFQLGYRAPTMTTRPPFDVARRFSRCVSMPEAGKRHRKIDVSLSLPRTPPPLAAVSPSQPSASARTRHPCRLARPLYGRVEAVAEQVQEHPREVLRIDLDRADRLRRSRVRALCSQLLILLRAGAVVGEVQRLIDQRVQIDHAPFTRGPAANVPACGADDAVVRGAHAR